MKAHPKAEEYELMSPADLAELGADIKARGQEEPIIISAGPVWQGALIDGRNRLRACEMMGIAPWIEEKQFQYNNEIISYIEGKNDLRRHFTEEQLEKRREERKARAAKLREEGKTTREIAEELGVGQSTVVRDLGDVPSEPSGSSGTEERRAEAVRLAQEGKPLRQIAEKLGVGVGTVHRDLTRPQPQRLNSYATGTASANPTSPRIASNEVGPSQFDETERRQAEKRRAAESAGTFRAPAPSPNLPLASTALANPQREDETPAEAQEAPAEETLSDPPEKDPRLCTTGDCRLPHLSHNPRCRHHSDEYEAERLAAAKREMAAEEDELPRVHYHSCPQCYQDKPCEMDCYVERDLYDSINQHHFSPAAICDECKPPPSPSEASQEEELSDEEDEAEEAPKRYVHWNTPPEVAALLEEFGGIDLDPCSNEFSQLKAAKIFTAEDDGLDKDWGAYVPGPFGLIYVNPPYGTAGQWARKCAETASAYPQIDIVLLVPARSGSGWFQDFVLKSADAICWWRGRIQFWREGAPFKGSANFDPIFACWGPSCDAFAEIFGTKGEVHDLELQRQNRAAA